MYKEIELIYDHIMSDDDPKSSIKMLMSFLESLPNIAERDPYRALAFTMASVVEAGQYRHETSGKMPENALKCRRLAIDTFKILSEKCLDNNVSNLLFKEVVPYLESAVNRFYPYRAVQISRAYDKIFHLMIRDEKLYDELKKLYKYKFIVFGTSGIRGIWGRDFNEYRIKATTQAICNFIERKWNPANKKLLVGYDTRLYSRETLRWAIDVLWGNDYKILYPLRDTPTPSLVYYGSKVADDICGILVSTASHNPYYWHGLKFILGDGMPAPSSVTYWIMSEANKIMLSNIMPRVSPSGDVEYVNILKWYTKYLEDTFDLNQISDFFRDKLIVIDEMHGAGRNYLSRVLDSIGVRHIILHGDINPRFGNLDYANPEFPYVAELIYSVKRFNAIVGFGMDADADRFGCVIDSNGDYYNANKVIMMLVRYLLTKKYRDKRLKVIKSFTTTDLLDKMLKILNVDIIVPRKDPIYRMSPLFRRVVDSGEEFKTFVTPVGIKYLAQAATMDEDYSKIDPKSAIRTFVLAGEESGGLTAYDHIFDKDGLYTIMLVLEMMARYGKSISEIYREIVDLIGEDDVSDRIDLPIPNEIKDEIINNVLDHPREIFPLGIRFCGGIENDFVEIKFDIGRVIFRLSGTEPILRIYMEGKDNRALGTIKSVSLSYIDELARELVHNINDPQNLIEVLLDTPPLPKTRDSVMKKVRELGIDKSVFYHELCRRMEVYPEKRDMIRKWIPFFRRELEIENLEYIILNINTIISGNSQDEIDDETYSNLERLLDHNIKLILVTWDWRLTDSGKRVLSQLKDLSKKSDILIYHSGWTRCGVFSDGEYRHVGYVVPKLDDVEKIVNILEENNCEILYKDDYCVILSINEESRLEEEELALLIENKGLREIGVKCLGDRKFILIREKKPVYNIVLDALKRKNISKKSVIYIGISLYKGGYESEVQDVGIQCISIGPTDNIFLNLDGIFYIGRDVNRFLERFTI
jgi:phosphomannomutase